jgi:para-aminobenzoate synthetase/4-amino-4-deoxychorismate lyase
VVDLATGQAEYGAGGGITWPSDPEAEWAELRDKCAILDGPERPCGLLETLRVDPGGGPVNLGRHVARLAASAAYFAIPVDPDTAAKELHAAVAGEVDGGRLRLLLTDAGELTVSLSALPQSAPGPVRLGWAAERVDSHDVRLFHKIADRSRYDRMRAARPEVDDVLVTNEWGEVTESTIANLAVQLDGRWWTPPIRCGLLPGVERARLVDAGQLAERVMTVADVHRAPSLAVVNSLRGWRPAVLVDASA